MTDYLLKLTLGATTLTLPCRHASSPPVTMLIDSPFRARGLRVNHGSWWGIGDSTIISEESWVDAFLHHNHRHLRPTTHRQQTLHINLTTCLIHCKIWNSIPLHIRQSQTYSSFRRHLKTHYFISAHLAP